MKVLTSNQIRFAEKSAVEHGLFSYAELMKKAGGAVFDEILRRYDIVGKKILIIAGCGNNGGDGLVIAAKLSGAGAFVTMCYPEGRPDTETARQFSAAVERLPVCKAVTDDYDFYIDALFGTGFNRLLSQETAYLVDSVNARSGVKVAVDLPSGVYCDGGMAQTAFKADLTVTFIGYKLCQLLSPTSSLCGEICFCSLDISTENDYAYNIILPPKAGKFDKNSNKGTFGTALLLCGSYGMCGAEILSAKAAVTSGAGIVKAIVCDKNYTAFTSAVPEAVTVPVETAMSGAPVIYDKTFLSSVSGAKSLLIGCGLGRSDEARAAVKKALRYTNIPVVIDADGINAVADDISILKNIDSDIILTPHPGEMARLLNTTVEDVEANRVNCAKRFACDNGCTVVLKGANTVVAAPDGEVFFNITGNYGMAKGGSGDVLSGIIVALLANGYDALSATLTAVYVHGKAGDAAAEKYTKRTMTPSDIIEELKFISF
ncbi:MAG: NAD(P)H-hydrate dehydratase [Clostridia bacterium]|nr:NAD(P)H-hydrate dehydratase [Clostridia bacterium]